MSKAEPTSIRIDEVLYERVVREAKENKRSKSAQIEFIIERYYEIVDKVKQ